MEPRILIGTPVFDYHRPCISEYTAALHNQTYQHFDIMMVDNSPTDTYINFLRQLRLPVFRVPFRSQMRERLADARNLIREVLLRGDYTHLLFVDQDVILPPFALQELLLAKKDIISGIYCKVIDTVRYAMIILPDMSFQAGETMLTPMEKIPSDLIFPIQEAGFGCLLIARHVCEEIAFRFNEDGPEDSDLMFCRDALTAGFDIACHSRVLCDHLYVERDFVKNPSWGYW